MSLAPAAEPTTGPVTLTPAAVAVLVEILSASDRAGTGNQQDQLATRAHERAMQAAAHVWAATVRHWDTHGLSSIASGMVTHQSVQDVAHRGDLADAPSIILDPLAVEEISEMFRQPGTQDLASAGRAGQVLRGYVQAHLAETPDLRSLAGLRAQLRACLGLPRLAEEALEGAMRRTLQAHRAQPGQHATPGAWAASAASAASAAVATAIKPPRL